MLADDDGRTNSSCGFGIGSLVIIGGLRERHQNRRRTADGQFTEAASTGATDGEIRVLQQGRHLIAEGALHIGGVLQLALFGVLVSTEMHDAATLLQQLRGSSPHHPVEPYGSLAAANHQQ